MVNPNVTIRKMYLTNYKNLIFLAFLISIAGSINAVSSKPQLPPGKPLLPPFLEGQRIDILIWGGTNQPNYITLPADETYFITHGWGLNPWSEYTPEEKKTALDQTAVGFRLYLDGEPIELKRWACHYKLFFDRRNEVWLEDVHNIRWYVQFELGDFDAGETYSFVGVWYWEGEGEWPFELCITFE